MYTDFLKYIGNY